MENILYKVRAEIKVGNDDWKILENRYRLRYGPIEKSQTVNNIYDTFEKLWEEAKCNSLMTNCTNKLTNNRFVKITRSLGAEIKVEEKDYKTVEIKTVPFAVSSNISILEVANNLSYEEFFKFWKDNELTP